MSVSGRLKEVMPTEVRVIGSRLRSANRAERGAVKANQQLPSSLEHSRRRPGSVWGVGMMRNEADTVEHVIEHMFRQDIDVLLIADNGSTDTTSSVLSSMSAVHPVHVVQDELVGYLQAVKMTMLASIARRCGADWIVPFDADELWFAHDRTVGSLLRATDASVVRAEIHNVFPRFDDDPDQADPFVRLRHMDNQPAPFQKVAFRTHPLATLTMGNLDVARRGRRVDGLFIAHYPWRSFEQMAEKLRHGRKAMEATDLQQQSCYHWRIGGGWSDEGVRHAWDDLRAGRAVEDLAWSPGPDLRPTSSGTARTWHAAIRSEQPNAAT